MPANHTPGPWTLERMIIPPKSKDRRCGFVVNGPENGEPLPVRICDLRVPSGMTGFSEGQSNARLIAVAPDMLETLELAAKLCCTARQHFPKSMHNGDKFQLENTAAAIGKVLANAKGNP